jgi:hypothetical protein
MAMAMPAVAAGDILVVDEDAVPPPEKKMLEELPLEKVGRGVEVAEREEKQLDPLVQDAARVQLEAVN